MIPTSPSAYLPRWTRWVFALAVLAQPLAGQGRRPPAFSTKVTAVDSVYASSPSVSPDGRWIVFGIASIDWTALSIAPADGGGSRLLTSRRQGNSAPVWFPSGDRIAYMSDRVNGIVVSDFDSRTGTLKGSPRRVTIEPAIGFDISPNGAWIAYATRQAQRNAVRLVPSRGGTARTLFDSVGRINYPRFSADGRQVYFSRVRGATVAAKPVELIRVPVDGGPATRVLVGPMTGRFFNVVADPARDRALHVELNRYVLTTLAGDTTAAFFSAGDPADIDGRFSADGGVFYTASADVGAAIRLVSTATREARDLTDHQAYNWPIGWSSDSKRVFYVGDSAKLVLSVDLDGRDTRQLSVSPKVSLVDTARIHLNAVSGDGRYLWIAQRPSVTRTERIHYLYDTQTRDLREITRTGAPAPPTGPGGSWLRYNHVTRQFYYIDRKPHGRELWAITPMGASRLIRAVPLELGDAFAVHGDRVIWREVRGDSAFLLFTRGATAPARRVWSGKGMSSSIAWSHDGRSLAAAIDLADDQSKAVVAFFDVALDGSLTETGRSAAVSDPWDMFWTPDDSAVTLLEYHGYNIDTRVARVPRNGEPITYIIPPGTTFWGHFPSPDGKHVVVPAEVVRGSSILRIDVKAAEAARRRSVTQAGKRDG